jgi:biotin operon repressor BirA-like protein
VSKRPTSLDDIDRRIVDGLRAEARGISGERLGAALGMSRVALWKRIQALKAWGYGIESGVFGHRLAIDDGIAPWELDPPGQLTLVAKTGSTMDEVWRLAVAGAPSGSLALALEQASGRGRLGGSWASPPGGLYFTVLLRVSLPGSYIGAVALEAGQALMAEFVGTGLEYRWPGSILMESALPDRVSDPTTSKAGGILVEHRPLSTGEQGYAIGIGLRAQAIASLGASRARRAALAVAIARRMAAWAAAPVCEGGRWASLAPPSGRPVSAELWDGSLRRFAPAGFNPRGELLEATGGLSLHLFECVELHEGV